MHTTGLDPPPHTHARAENRETRTKQEKQLEKTPQALDVLRSIDKCGNVQRQI